MKIKWKIAVAVAVAVALVSLTFRSCSLEKERDRYKNDYEVLTTSFTELKVNDSLNAAEINALRLTKSEMEERLGEDAEIIRKLSKGKDTKDVEIVEVVRYDSILVPVYRSDSSGGEVIKFHHCDEWKCVDGTVFGDSADIDVKTKESLIITESLVKKKFLFIKLPTKIFGYKTKAMDVVSKCPSTTITNVEYISIE